MIISDAVAMTDGPLSSARNAGEVMIDRSAIKML